MEQKQINLRDCLNNIIKKLNILEVERLKVEGYINECFFNENGSLTENYKIKLLEKKKYFYINFGNSGAFMIAKECIKGYPLGSIFNIKGYGTPNFNKYYGEVFNILPKSLFNLRYDYRR